MPDDTDYYTPMNLVPGTKTLADVVGWLESFMRLAESPDDSQPRWSDFEMVRDVAVTIQRELMESRTPLGCLDPRGDLLGEEMSEKVYGTDEEADL